MISRVALALLLASATSVASAGGFRSVSCGHHAVAVAAPVVVTPPVYATVAPQYQEQAQAVAGFRQSPEWKEYQQLIGYRTAMEQVFASQGGYVVATGPEEPESPPATAPPVSYDTPKPVATPPCASGGQVCASTAPPQAAPSPEPIPPELAAVKQSFKNAYPLADASCSKCHNSPESKGGFDLATVLMAAKQNGDCETLRSIAQSVSSGRMPKGGTLTPDERLNLIDSILDQPVKYD